MNHENVKTTTDACSDHSISRVSETYRALYNSRGIPLAAPVG